MKNIDIVILVWYNIYVNEKGETYMNDKEIIIEYARSLAKDIQMHLREALYKLGDFQRVLKTETFEEVDKSKMNELKDFDTIYKELIQIADIVDDTDCEIIKKCF